MGAIVQARMSSTRLPGKVLLPLAGRPVLEHVLSRLDRADGLDEILVATSVEPGDDAIERFCRARGTRCVRGPLHDVAGRLLRASAGLDAFVRVCADSPLLDPDLVSAAVAEFRRRGVEGVDLVTNVFPRRTAPPGRSVEVVGTAVFAEAVAVMTDPAHREHVTTHFYTRHQDYRIHNIAGDRGHDDRSLTVDTADDLARLESLVPVQSGRRPGGPSESRAWTCTQP